MEARGSAKACLTKAWCPGAPLGHVWGLEGQGGDGRDNQRGMQRPERAEFCQL